LRKTKDKRQCKICGRHEELNYINLKYFKMQLCETCTKWFATLGFNTVRRFNQILRGELID